MTVRRDLTVVVQPQDFFRELITCAVEKQSLKIQPETEFYLVNLLNEFMTTPQVPGGPLALMVKDALEESQSEKQKVLFKKVGDTSLYVAGYFQDSLNRKLVDVDYYIEMGGIAYKQVAVRADSSSHRPLYEELADKFSSFVEVLAEVSTQTTPKSEKDLLRLYEVWVQTKSERAARALQEAGILPNDTIKKNWQ